MKLSIERLVQQHDAVTIFVVLATVVIIIELLLMRILVPAVPDFESQETNVMMDQVCDVTNMLRVTRNLKNWEQESSSLVKRLSGDATQWQRELVTYHAFSERQVPQEILPGEPDIRVQQVMEADFAVRQLSLQSVMIGRTPLANINGKIYTVGDKI